MFDWIDAHTSDAGVIAAIALFHIALNWRVIRGR